MYQRQFIFRSLRLVYVSTTIHIQKCEVCSYINHSSYSEVWDWFLYQPHFIFRSVRLVLISTTVHVQKCEVGSYINPSSYFEVWGLFLYQPKLIFRSVRFVLKSTKVPTHIFRRVKCCWYFQVNEINCTLWLIRNEQTKQTNLWIIYNCKHKK